jgi:membrane fusion protein (multidrug efflux system)
MENSMKTITCAMIFTAVIFVSCHQKQDAPGRRSADNRNAVKEYAVLTLSPKTVTTHLDFPATIEGQQVIEIRPMISGYIHEIHVNEGDRVKKGQLLFNISNPQYEQDVITAKARIQSAAADVDTAKMELEKVRPLVEKEIVSKYGLQSAEYTLQAKEAALAQAQAALANAKTNLGYTIIHSPQDGLIGTIPYKIGALVNSNSKDALTTLSNIDYVFAYFSWNEKKLLDFLSETKGATLAEKLAHLPPAILILANGTEYPEKGKIEMASGLISTETGSAIFKAIFPNPTGIIRSGASATIRIPQVHENVLVIPQQITSEIQDKRFVYVVGKDNKVSGVSITATSTDDGQYFLVSKGLKAGDRVILEGIPTLREGMVITPKEADVNSSSG